MFDYLSREVYIDPKVQTNQQKIRMRETKKKKRGRARLDQRSLCPGDVILTLSRVKLAPGICDFVSFKIVDGDFDGTFVFEITFYRNNPKAKKDVPVKTIKMENRFKFRLTTDHGNQTSGCELAPPIPVDLSDLLDMMISPEMAREVIQEILQVHLQENKMQVELEEKHQTFWLTIKSPKIKERVSEEVKKSELSGIIVGADVDDEDDIYGDSDIGIDSSLDESPTLMNWGGNNGH